MQSGGDAIHISELEISARVGVPDQERAEPQRLVVSVTLWPNNNFGQLSDDLAETVDYSAVAKCLREFVATRADKLIETLASAIARDLLERFSIDAVRIELRKFVIPNSKHVAVIITRTR